MLGKTLKQRYKLVRILGAGGFGQTYLADDVQQSSHPQYVVKQLRPASQDKNFLSVARRLFDTEAKILEKLGDHTQIPTLIDFFEEDSEFYLVQEFIDGHSLEAEIKQTEQFSEEQAIALLQAVLPILDFIHENHVVHRDLKPDNLIRRKDSNEMVLIDFGAVKEIRTHLITGEKTGLTIGIGTQGYTPSEQLSGKPRYSSDIYALGMTAIHALTGRPPTDLPEAMGSLDPQWQEYTSVSPGLKILLGKMTRHYIHQRYQTVSEVLHDLNRLEELPAEAAEAKTYIETAFPGEMLASEAQTTITRWEMKKRAKRLTAIISTVVTSAVILGLRQAGAFVTPELAVWDRMVSLQPDKGPDPRLLIVGVTEQDLTEPGSITPSDAALAKVINNLQTHEPARVALDLLRSQPEGEGAAELQQSLQASNVVAIMKLSDPGRNNAILPPPGMAFEQLSFNNIVVDRDFRVRRSLMVDFLDTAFVQSERGENLVEKNTENEIDPIGEHIYSLGTETAIHYLEQYENIMPADSDILQLGDSRFEPLTSTFGGYRNIDADGYQLFMRYRSQNNIAERISFTDVLNNNFNPALVKDKIVFIGAVGDNSRDLFLTPYNTDNNTQLMHGVEVHAQLTSQILSAAIDGERLLWSWPDEMEVAWIIVLAGVGSVLMVLTQRGIVLIAFGVGGLVIAFAVGAVSFGLGGWVPIVAPMSAFFWSAAGTRISKSYQRRYWETKQTEAFAVRPSDLAT